MLYERGFGLFVIEVMGSSPVSNISDRTWEKFVNTLPNVGAFLRVLRFPPSGIIDSVG